VIEQAWHADHRRHHACKPSLGNQHAISQKLTEATANAPAASASFASARLRLPSEASSVASQESPHGYPAGSSLQGIPVDRDRRDDVAFERSTGLSRLRPIADPRAVRAQFGDRLAFLVTARFTRARHFVHQRKDTSP